MTRPISKTQAFILGTFSIIALLILTGLLFKNNRWKSTIIVSAKFNEANGLQKSTRIHFRGVDVGEVTSIDINPDYINVNMMLIENIKVIGNDAKVKIVRENLLGERFLKIISGESKEDIKNGDILQAIEIPDAFEDLSSVTQKLNLVISKLNQLISTNDGTLGKLMNDNRLYDELTNTTTELKLLVSDIRQGEGVVGSLLEDAKTTLISVRQNSDAVKNMPGVRNYVVDINKELIRPEMKRLRKVYSEEELFEPGTALLTKEGQSKLKSTIEWLKEYRLGEIVVATVSSNNPVFAKTLTQKQSDAVKSYFANGLKTFWWNSRQIKSIGCGNYTPKQPETELLPENRIEIILFLPTK